MMRGSNEYVRCDHLKHVFDSFDSLSEVEEYFRT